MVADGNGLYIRIRKKQSDVSRTWQFRRKERGELTITTLGTYPELSIKEARLKAAELATKRQTSSPTVQEVAEQWLAERIDHTHRKADQVRGYVDRAIIPELGSTRVRDIEPSDIARVIRTYRDRVAKLPRARTGGRPAARALLAVFKGLFGYAVANGWIAQSPAAQLTAAVTGPPPLARSRVLSDDEIRFVMTTDIRPGPILRFLLLTGLRLGEAYNGHRDGQYWVVPAKASKNGREHRVWLSDLALAQLDAHPWKARREAVQSLAYRQCRRLDRPRSAADLQHAQHEHGRGAIRRGEDAQPHLRRDDELSTTMPPTTPSGARRWKRGPDGCGPDEYQASRCCSYSCGGTADGLM